MHASIASPCLRILRLAVCLAWAGAFAAAPARAADFTVLLADDEPAHVEFARLLRDADEAQDDGSVAVGVRTRGLRTLSAAPTPVTVTVAVGATAARAALDRPGAEVLLLAMLSRLDYESLKTSPGLRRTDRRVGVLLRDPAPADALAVIDAVLPHKRRLGAVVTAEAQPLVRELEHAAAGWDLQVQYTPDATSLATALRTLVSRSDALIVLPGLIGDDQAATLAVLRAGAGAGLPVFGTNEGLVRSGGLAAAVSTPARLAQQARAMAQKLARGGATMGGSGVLVESALPATVRVNATVALALGLRLPDERELMARVNAAR